jgi:hypothetical protein
VFHLDACTLVRTRCQRIWWCSTNIVTYIYISIYLYIRVQACTHNVHIWLCIYMCSSMSYIYTFITCMYVYIHIYTYTYMCIQLGNRESSHHLAQRLSWGQLPVVPPTGRAMAGSLSLPICSHHGQSEPVAGRAYNEACLILIIATVATAAKSSICRSLSSTAGIASTS